MHLLPISFSFYTIGKIGKNTLLTNFRFNFFRLTFKICCFQYLFKCCPSSFCLMNDRYCPRDKETRECVTFRKNAMSAFLQSCTNILLIICCRRNDFFFFCFDIHLHVKIKLNITVINDDLSSIEKCSSNYYCVEFFP